MRLGDCSMGECTSATVRMPPSNSVCLPFIHSERRGGCELRLCM
jgi:hypothetical protein